jgi:DNA-binding response OmpR family regulator/EAL domain-containing protein (putative c-di-GMP-specific phosphodiesterase class I)
MREWKWSLFETFCHQVIRFKSTANTLGDPELDNCLGELMHLLQNVPRKIDYTPPDITPYKLILTAIKTRILALDASEPVIEKNVTPRLGHDGITIALLENDKNIENSVKTYLGKKGYTVRVFTNPLALKDAMKVDIFDIVLIDFLQANSALANRVSVEDLLNNVQGVPIILLAERDDLATRLVALRAGVKAYLTKPLNQVELLDKINTILAKRNEHSIKVLMVDDDVMLTKFYDVALAAEGFSVRCINNPLDILQSIELFQPDVISLDYHMPECNGLEIAEILRGDPRYMKIPIIFMSATDDLTKNKQLISVFGNSFLNKSVDIAVLRNALIEAAKKAKKVDDNIEKISIRKSASGLQNREYFLSTLDELMRSSGFQSDLKKYYLVMIKIDNVDKNDHLLRSTDIAKIKESVEDFFSRQLLIGGNGCFFEDNNYLLLLTDDSCKSEALLLSEFHESFRQKFTTTIPLVEPLTISLAVLPINDLASVSLDDVVACIEKANSAVEHAPNTICWAESPALRQAQPLIKADPERFKRKIVDALKKRAFQLVYQPIIKPESEEHMFEALVRLVDDDGELHLPERFMPLLDEVLEDGYYILDRWVIEHAFNALEGNNSRGAAEFSVVIKLCPDLKQMERLLPFIYNMVSNTHLHGAKSRIFFSASAQSILMDITRAKRIVESLHKAKCGFMVDHWMGTEQSIGPIASLKYIDFIKLDPCFNAQLSDPLQIKHSIARLCSAIGGDVNIVASLIEDAKTFSQFWEMNIRYFQGYFIHRPNDVMQQRSLESESFFVDQ